MLFKGEHVSIAEAEPWVIAPHEHEEIAGEA
jgi:hypothetical protein